LFLKGNAMFRFYSNTFSQATRSVAVALFVIALTLVGVGVLIIAFPAVFAFLAALIFFIAGGGFLAVASKILLGTRRMRSNEPSDNYRDNVRIHELDDFDGD
jgi:hypothetical protein